MNFFQNKTRENIHSPSWTGLSSPRSPKSPLATHLHCPCCHHSFQPNLDPHLEAVYSSDEFRMYHFKVERCPLVRTTHDWTNCPYLHPGEKARRRDPRKFRYSSELCADFRKNGKCAKRDRCQFAHGVFEMWLHPDKYRTELCRDGTTCTRKVCFFAHSMQQLRWPRHCDSDPMSESELSSVPSSPSDSAHLPKSSSLLSAIVVDMQRTQNLFEVPDIRWVSDLVDS